MVGLIAILAIAGAATTLLLVRPWADPVDVAVETAVPTETTLVTPTPTVEPSPPPPPLAVLGASLEWIPTGMSCEVDETFEMKATGTILLDNQIKKEESRVGPGGWLEEPNPGYEGQFGFPPGALIGRLDTDEAISYGFSFSPDGVATGIANYTCPFAGQLLLGISDPDVSDNEGEFSVQIVKVPAG